MLQLECTQGYSVDWILTAINRADGSLPTAFLATDTLTADLWAGEMQASLLKPFVSWSDYTTGAVLVGLTSGQTVGLEAGGIYHVMISASRMSKTVDIIECLLKVNPAPGTGTQLVQPYCTLEDMLDHAPWITMIQDIDADQTGFYEQRLEAKTWLDWLIVRSWRGTSTALYGDPGRQAQYWSGSGIGRTPLPSQWLINTLSGGFVLPAITVATPGSGYTFANVVFSGGGAPAGGQASGFPVISGGQIISIMLIQPGYGYTSVPTIAIMGNGTGATATCLISSNTLILRPQVVRVCALKAASIAGIGQIGRMNNIASYGAMFRDMASSEASTIVAELDLNGNGVADLAIPLGVTNTLFT